MLDLREPFQTDCLRRWATTCRTLLGLTNATR
ncbi:hypothetical protein [Enterobacter phage N5822]|nr:hypothetical protein [Enterobacter phage N5822]QPD96254.1 hypothetical protein [Enterobacter phage N5822]